MSLGLIPDASIASTSPAFAMAVRARPLYLPSAFALAMPSRCLSSMTSRSKSESVKIVRELQRPIPLGEMAKHLEQRGIKLGGKNPNQALSANLGHCAELRPTPRGWWLKGVPVPRENAKIIGGADELPGLN